MTLRAAYSTDFEGGRPVRMRYAVVGRMDVAGFMEFVVERAGWLGLSGWVAPGAQGVTLVASGPEALVGALEMACTLGPLDALVDSIVGEATAEPVPPGFLSLQK